MIQDRLHETRDIFLRKYCRSHDALYNVNKAIKIFNMDANNGEDWKVKSTHHSLRRELTDEEHDRLRQIAVELRTVDVSPQLKYYILRL